jgi:hypothetical protein
VTDAELDAIEALAREELPRPYYGSDPAQTLALVSALREARRVLRAVQWQDGNDNRCRLCRASGHAGHVPGCALAEAIR